MWNWMLGVAVIAALALSIWSLVRSYDEKTSVTTVVTPSVGSGSIPLDTATDPQVIVWAPGCTGSNTGYEQLKDTWADVYAARQAVKNLPVRIVLNNSYGTATANVRDFAITGSATYDLTNTEFFAPMNMKLFNSSNVVTQHTITIATGVKIVGLRGIDGPISLVYAGETAAGHCMNVDPQAGDTVSSFSGNRNNTFYIKNYAQVRATNLNAPFLRVSTDLTTTPTNARQFVIFIENYGRLVGSGATAPVQIGGNTNATQYAGNQLILEIGTMGGYDIGCIRTHADVTAGSAGSLTVILSGVTRVQGTQGDATNSPALVPFPFIGAQATAGAAFPLLSSAVMVPTIVNRMPAMTLYATGALATAAFTNILGSPAAQNLSAAYVGFGCRPGDLVKVEGVASVFVMNTSNVFA